MLDLSARALTGVAVAALVATACTSTDEAADPTATTTRPASPTGEASPSPAEEALPVTNAPDVQPPDDAPFRQSPWWPYLSAHIDDEEPGEVVGGRSP